MIPYVIEIWVEDINLESIGGGVQPCTGTKWIWPDELEKPYKDFAKAILEYEVKRHALGR